MTVDEPEESIKFENGSGVAYNEGLVNGYEPMISFSQGHNDYESLEDMHAREMAEVDIFESLHQLAMLNFNVENETPMNENSDSLDECLAHFENSNDPIIQEILKPYILSTWCLIVVMENLVWKNFTPWRVSPSPSKLNFCTHSSKIMILHPTISIF